MLLSFSSMCGGMDKLGASDWGGERGEERACELKVCCTLPTVLLGSDRGAVFHLLLPSSRQTKGTVRDLEIPESVVYG